MSTDSTTVAYDWIRQIDPKIHELDQTPLFGHAPLFPWEEFSEKLRSRLQLDSLEIKRGEVIWRAEEELYQDFGDNAEVVTLGCTGLEGLLYFVIRSDDLQKIISHCAGEIPPEGLRLFPPEVTDAFKEFLRAETLYTLGETSFDPTLSPHILSEKPLPAEPALGIQMQIHIGPEHFPARLLLPEEFLNSWRAKFAEEGLYLSLKTELLSKLHYTLGMEIGISLCSSSDLEELKAGDILLLDRAAVSQEKGEAEISCTNRGKPLFSAHLSEGRMKVSAAPILSAKLEKLKQIEPAQARSDEDE